MCQFGRFAYHKAIYEYNFNWILTTANKFKLTPSLHTGIIHFRRSMTEHSHSWMIFQSSYLLQPYHLSRSHFESQHFSLHKNYHNIFKFSRNLTRISDVSRTVFKLRRFNSEFQGRLNWIISARGQVTVVAANRVLTNSISSSVIISLFTCYLIFDVIMWSCFDKEYTSKDGLVTC